LISFEKKKLFDSEKINTLKYDRHEKKNSSFVFFYLFISLQKISAELLLLSDRFERAYDKKKKKKKKKRRRRKRR